jgi:deoxyadenosine/deoxycytidine kinase
MGNAQASDRGETPDIYTRVKPYPNVISERNVKQEDNNQIDNSNGDRKQKQYKRKILILVEGNISSGKSTLVKELRRRNYKVYEEAVDRLTGEYVDSSGRNILDLFYSNMKEHAFKLQVASLSMRWTIVKEALKYLLADAKIKTDDDIRMTNATHPDIVFIERSVYTDVNSFALNLFEQGFIDPLEWKIYLDLLCGHLDDTKSHFEGVECHYIYLKTDANECFRRKIERGRVEENTVPLEYFQTLEIKNDIWLLNQSGAEEVDNKPEKIEKPMQTHSEIELNRHINESRMALKRSFNRHVPIVVDGNKSQMEVLDSVLKISFDLLVGMRVENDNDVVIKEYAKSE